MGNSFGKQFWGTALGSSFGKLSGLTLRNNYFEEQQLWEQLSGAALQLRGAAFSSNCREQLSGASLQNSFGEPFWGTGLKNRSFGHSFWELLCRMALGSRFGKQVCRIPALENSFGAQLLGELRPGTALDSFNGPALRQLRAAALEFWGASFGRSFR